MKPSTPKHHSRKLTFTFTISSCQFCFLWQWSLPESSRGCQLCTSDLCFFSGSGLVCLALQSATIVFFSHKSFEAGPVTKLFLAFSGMMALHGSIPEWVFMHRVHHRACDHELDFHSPWFASPTALKACKPRRNETNWESHVQLTKSKSNFWWSHAAWQVGPGLRPHLKRPETRREIMSDMLDDPDLQYYRARLFIDRPAFFVELWIVLCLVAAVSTTTIKKWPVHRGMVLALYYLGVYAALPLIFSWNSTMLVNSAVHLWGDIPNMDGMLPGADMCQARNNVWLFPILLGENWHNNHHAAPMSASAWSRWYQVDFAYLAIRIMELFGWVWNVRTETPIPRQGYEESKRDACIMAAHMAVIGLILTWLVKPLYVELKVFLQRLAEPLRRVDMIGKLRQS